MGKDVEYTRDGYRCDELYRAKVPYLVVDGVKLKPGDTFHPTPDMNLGALLQSVFVGKVRAKKPKTVSDDEKE